jgi:hypothetical protein
MASKRNAVLGALATAGVVGAAPVLAAGTETEGPLTCASPETAYTSEYGPASAAGIVAGGQINQVINSLGAPYQTFASGPRTVYQWGHGITVKNPDGNGSIQRDELLVTADGTGTITSVSYRTKCTACGALAMIYDSCP